MLVGVGRLALALDGVSSLKEKRAVVRRVIDRTRHRFNAAVAEVDAQDVLDRAVVGVAVVSNDAGHCDRMLEEILASIEALGAAPVLWRRNQRIVVGASAGRRAELEGVVGDWDALEEP